MHSHRDRLSRFLALGAVVAAGSVLCVQLFIPPILGLANNGDFDRIMGKVGLRYVGTTRSENYVNWALGKLAFAEPTRPSDGYATSEAPLAFLAVAASRAVSADGLFDIRFLGAVHAAVLLAALAGLVLSCGDLSVGAQAAVAALLVFCFADVGYVAPLNSLYTQAGSLLYFMLAAAFAATAVRRGRLDRGLLAGYFLAAGLFVTSRPQESIQGPLLAALGVGLAGAFGRRWWRQPVVWLAVALCAVSFAYYRKSPDWLRQLALYDTLFREVLPSSPDAAADLGELGLDPALARYSGRSPYPLDSPFHDPAFKAAVFGRFSYGSLTRFYVFHPGRLGELVMRAAPSAVELRPVALGNYTRESGWPARTQATSFGWWSGVRAHLGPVAHVWLPVLLLGNLVVAAAGYRRASPRGRLFRQAVAIFVLMAIVEFFVALIADIPGDIARHLYVFHAMCDLLLIGDLAWILEGSAARAAQNTRLTPIHG